MQRPTPRQHVSEFSPPSDFTLGQVRTGKPGGQPNIFTQGGKIQQRAKEITDLNEAGLNLGQDGQTSFRNVAVTTPVAQPTVQPPSPVKPDEQAQAEGAFGSSSTDTAEPTTGETPEGSVTPEEATEATEAFADNGKVAVQSSAGQSMSNVKPPKEEDEQ